MSKKLEKNLIVGLDIGTSKVVAIVGEITPDDEVEIIGLGSHPSRGLKKGVVVNIESTVQSIQRAVEEAELMAGCQIHSVYAGIFHPLRGVPDHRADQDRRVKDVSRKCADSVPQKTVPVYCRGAGQTQPYDSDIQDHCGSIGRKYHTRTCQSP